LDLVFDYPNTPKVESMIKFTEVAAYNFIQTGGSILTDIHQTKLSEISKELNDDLTKWARDHGGLPLGDGNHEICIDELEKDGYAAWTIWSAVGFKGIVIAKGVR
jgi:hypothetical protein